MVSLLDLAPITDSNNETLQEHLDEIKLVIMTWQQ